MAMGKLSNFLIAIYAIGQTVVIADFEVCTPGISNTVFKFSYEKCPFGVLFENPISATCIASTNLAEHYITDLCNPSRSKLGINDSPYQFQLAFQMDPEPVDTESSCFGAGPNKCDALTVTVNQATSETLTPPQRPGCDLDYSDKVVNLTPEEEARRKDLRVFNQTERLFKYMLGLIDVSGQDDGSHLRVIKLLKSCFKLFKKFIGNTRFVPVEFVEDVLKAFLFLFRESDLTNFIDISFEDFQAISKTLTYCESMAPPFTLVGKSCRTCASVYSFQKMGKTFRYMEHENEFAFEWGKYDVPTDATWSIISFVHGLCYGTYRTNINYHHLFEQQMERLFTSKILYRWTRPSLLYHENLWDHIFSTSVKNAMRNLDVSIFGAYHETPFSHRLERPVQGKANNRGKRRKNARSSVSLDDSGLKGAGWCFQTESELVVAVNEYISYHCPHVTFPEEIIATLESQDARDALNKSKSTGSAFPGV